MGRIKDYNGILSRDLEIKKVTFWNPRRQRWEFGAALVKEKEEEKSIAEFHTYDSPDGMTNYRKKPLVVSAKRMHEPFKVWTLEGMHTGKKGDYLIKGISGELYPCKRRIFEESYDQM